MYNQAQARHLPRHPIFRPVGRPRRHVHPTYSIANETELTTVQALYYLLILMIDDELSIQLEVGLWQSASYAVQTG